MDPAVVDVAFEERYWYPHDGGVVWVSGYQLVDRESGRYLARDAPEVVEAGLIVASVAGRRAPPRRRRWPTSTPSRPGGR